MKFEYRELEEAVEKKIITKDQLDNLVLLKQRSPQNNKIMNLLYYSGALLVISALSWLMKSSWDSFGGGGIFVLTLIYIIFFLICGIYLQSHKQYEVPAGLLFSIIICLIPLLVFGLLKYLNHWPSDLRYGDFYFWIKGKWVILEISGILVGLTIFYFIKFPFLLAPISFGLWFLSMDIVPLIFQTNSITWTDRKYISLIFGMLILIAGYITHKRSDEKYSFWLYLFGLLTLTSALSIFYNSNNLMFIVFFVVNLGFILFSLILDQKVFLVFGSIGLMEFLGRFSYRFFKGTVFFPFILSAIGIVLIIIGIYYQRNQTKIDTYFEENMPQFFKRFKP